MIESQPPDLMEVGTRFKHYMELVDIFNLGIEVIKGMSASVKTEGDEKTLVELQHAAYRIERRIDALSNYKIKQADMRKVIEFELPKRKELPPCPA